MNFGKALEALEDGQRVARAGWNGKGMWLAYVKSYTVNFVDLSQNALGEQPLLPWIGMKTADNKFVPWLASQTDVLAKDWEIVT